jgi:NAD(P)-dependent dehydrogenase (short-subunit alcohol dehydrogenase family)
MTDRLLGELSDLFDQMYSTMGRPSIAPEKLLRALLRQVLYTVRGERMLMEQLDYNLTGRNAERLRHAASEVDALSTAAFDAADPVALDRFFRDLPTIDHVMVTAGRPYYGRLADMDFAKIRDLIGEHLLVALYVARNATNKVRPGGTLIFMGGTGGRRPAIGMSIAGAVTAALPALTANLALEIAPVRVNLIAAGFVDTPLSAELLGESARKTAQPASHHASHRTRGRTGGRGRARRTHYDQHRPHGRNL